MKRHLTLLITTLGLLSQVSFLPAQERLTFLYPSPAGSWVIPVVAKDARYFDGEGLSVELVRVGGSTRIVAALVGGSAQLIHAGEPAVIPAVARGADVVVIAAISKVPQHRLIARPEIKEVKDLKGKPVGITSFGASSDFILRYALQKNGLDPNKDVSILQTGGQPENLCATHEFSSAPEGSRNGNARAGRFFPARSRRKQRHGDYHPFLHRTTPRHGGQIHESFYPGHASLQKR